MFQFVENDNQNAVSSGSFTCALLFHLNVCVCAL